MASAAVMVDNLSLAHLASWIEKQLCVMLWLPPHFPLAPCLGGYPSSHETARGRRELEAVGRVQHVAALVLVHPLL